MLTRSIDHRDNMQHASKLILACIYLHNFLLLRNDATNLSDSEIRRKTRLYQRRFKVETQQGPDQNDGDSPELTRSKLLKFVRYRRQNHEEALEDSTDEEDSDMDEISDTDGSELPEDER